MTNGPHLPPPEPADELKRLGSEYLQLRNADLTKAKSFFFGRIFPLLQPLLEAIPEHRALRHRQPPLLVSTMGFSPETSAIATCLLRPSRLVIVRSGVPSPDGDDTAIGYSLLAEYLTRMGVLPFASIAQVVVDAYDPVDILHKVEQAIEGVAGCVIDITGGTKVMSATVGFFGFQRNLPLCYIEGGWNPRLGAAAVSSSLRLSVLDSPLSARGHEFAREARRLYGAHAFADAMRSANAAVRHLLNNQTERLLERLCRVYAAFHQQITNEPGDSIEWLVELLDEHAIRAVVPPSWELGRHIHALKRASDPGDEEAQLALMLVMAETQLRIERLDLAMTYAYRSLETALFLSLRAKAGGHFDPAQPDYAQFGADEETLRMELAGLFPNAASHLPHRVGLVDAFRLLCAVDGLHERLAKLRDRNWPTRAADAMGRVAGAAQSRNRSIVGHGTARPTLQGAVQLVTVALDVVQAMELPDQSLAELRRDLLPRRLDDLGIHAP